MQCQWQTYQQTRVRQHAKIPSHQLVNNNHQLTDNPDKIILRAWFKMKRKIQLNVHYLNKLYVTLVSIKWNNITPSLEVRIILITTEWPSFYPQSLLPARTITLTSAKWLHCFCPSNEAFLPSWSCSVTYLQPDLASAPSESSTNFLHRVSSWI